jgi:hypothetical protein
LYFFSGVESSGGCCDTERTKRSRKREEQKKLLVEKEKKVNRQLWEKEWAQKGRIKEKELIKGKA